MTLPFTAFILAVIASGTAVIAHSAMVIHPSSLSGYAVLLALLTIVSDRFSIKVPGRAATVSVSEVFIFSSVLWFGPAVPTLTVAIDGLTVSLMQQDRRLYRTLFNVAEPAISTWVAGQVFFAVAGVSPGATLSTGPVLVVPATIAMAAAFFVLNSGLSAAAVAMESHASILEFWRSHAWSLGVNYYAAASLAALAVGGGLRINFGVIGLIAPLLLLSYVAYREAATRVDDAHQHILDIERLYRASIDMLAIAVDAKDQVTAGHIHRVQRHTLALAAGLGVTDRQEIKAIETGALLHDIGKIAVPDYVLNKPSALTPPEFEVMKKHVSMGARILNAVAFPYPIVPIVRHHHERWDGRGYPDGLVGAEIPLGARILSVVDCFDALTSDRPYRPRLTDAQAADILRARQGTFYDPAVVDKFIELIPDLRASDRASGEGGDDRASIVAGLTRSVPASAIDGAIVQRGISLPASVEAAIERQIGAIGGAAACLFGLNPGRDALIVAYATGRIRAAVAMRDVPVGAGVSGWVAANRSTIRQADAVLDIGDAATCGLRSCASVPVFVRADLFGVLTIYVPDEKLSDDIVDAVGLLAQGIGLSLAKHSAGASNRTHLRIGLAPASLAAVS